MGLKVYDQARCYAIAMYLGEAGRKQNGWAGKTTSALRGTEP
jgi:hypothetical protein